MGGSQSTTSTPVPDTAGTGRPRPDNNNGDVVVIPVDASQQAEAAFLCEICPIFLCTNYYEELTDIFFI